MSCGDNVCGTGGWGGPLPGDPSNNLILTATAAYGGVDVSWTYPTTNPYAVSHVILYRGTSPSFLSATERAIVSSDFYFDRVSTPDIKQYFYWIKVVSINGTEGELIGPSSATPLSRLAELLLELVGSLDASYLTVSLKDKLDKIPLLEAGIANETLARFTETEAIAAALAAAQSETGESIAYVMDELNKKTTTDQSLLAQINLLATSLDTANALIISEQTTRSAADLALANDISLLQSSLESDGVVGSAIITAQSTATTAAVNVGLKNKTFFQDDTPVATAIGDIWLDTNNNNKILRWDGYFWVDASDTRINSTASTVNTLQTTVDGHTSTIAENIESINGLGAQYTVKINNNGQIAGFGLASTPVNGEPYSEFTVLANAFKIGSPTGNTTPFAVVDTGGGVYKTLLNSDVVIGGNVEIANLKSGSLANNVKMSLGNGIIDLDGSGEIRVYKDLSTNADYVRLSAGELRFLKYINGSYQTYNYLSRLESGVASNGTEVVIPGYWKAQPRVMVSPSSIQMYSKTYSGQDQAINCQANSIVETTAGSMQWKFTPVATLTLASSTITSTPNEQDANNTNTWYTSEYTANSNSASINVSVDLSSNRGTGGAATYYRRSVTWTIQYFNGATWVDGVSTVVDIGPQLGYVTSTKVFTFPSAGAWQFRCKFVASDAGGATFSSGAAAYDYATDLNNINADLGRQMIQFWPAIGTEYSESLDILAGAYTTPSGWEITSVRYQYEYGYYQYCVNVNTGNAAESTITGRGFTRELSAYYGNTPYFSGDIDLTNGTSNVTYYPVDTTTTGNSYNRVIANLYNSRGNFNNRVDTYCHIKNLSVWINRRRLQVNSTTADNNSKLNSFTLSLSTAQVLATGTLNWIAVGE